jgi:nucleoside-diphosphate-sugar epimerase
MRELAEMIWDYCGREEDFAVSPQDAFDHDVEKRVPDSSKAEEKLGWKPEITLSESLDEYVTWYMEHIQ